MRLNTADEKPWAKDFFTDVEVGIGTVYPLLKGKITSKQGIILEAEEFKVYCFPKSTAAKWIINWLEENRGVYTQALVVERSEGYPGFILSNEHENMCEVHSNIMGDITLTPTLSSIDPKEDKPGKRRNKA